jgi:hypothetical protein
MNWERIKEDSLDPRFARSQRFFSVRRAKRIRGYEDIN